MVFCSEELKFKISLNYLLNLFVFINSEFVKIRINNISYHLIVYLYYLQG